MYITYHKDTKKVAYVGNKKPVAYSENLALAEVESVPETDGYLTYENDTLIAHNKTDEEKARFEASVRIAELKKLLFDTDYQAIKYAEGELSADDYAEMKAQRKAWRKEINELEQV